MEVSVAKVPRRVAIKLIRKYLPAGTIHHKDDTSLIGWQNVFEEIPPPEKSTQETDCLSIHLERIIDWYLWYIRISVS